LSGRSVRHRLEQVGLRAARLGSHLLPEAVASQGGLLIGVLAGSVFRVRRGDVERHLEWAFPERSARWRSRVAGACYRHFGREMVSTLRAVGWTAAGVRDRTATEGFEEFRESYAEGKGLVLLTGHLGNWEVGGAAIAARGVPLDVVGKGMSNPYVQTDLFALRERLGMRVIEMGRAPKPVLQALSEGRVVALLGDQSAHRGGISVPFFGRPAATARGPALLATRSGAPVFVAFALRAPGRRARYKVTFERLPFSPTGDVEGDAAALAGAYNRSLEEAVRLSPEQYFWHHRRWKAPFGEEPLRDG